MKKTKSLYDSYKFPGFIPERRIKGVFGDKNAVIIPLIRKEKKQHVAAVAKFLIGFMTGKKEMFEIFHAVTNVYIFVLKSVELFVEIVKK